MIALYGNCQAGFLAEALTAKGHAAEFSSLSTPLSLLRSPGRVPRDLAERMTRLGLLPYLHERSLESQFLMRPAEEPEPDLYVLNLFHENRPLFSHKETGYVFYVDPQAWEASPEFEAWMKRHFQLIKPDPLTYPQRFGDMLLRFRERHPGPPLIVLGRLSHFPAFGPNPYSYLECWDAVHDQAGPALTEFLAGLPGCRYLDLDRILAGLMARGEARIEAHCPFLRTILEDGPAGTKRLILRRDLEHAGSLWGALADKLAAFLATGQLAYAPEERIPEAWTRTTYVPESPPRKRLAGLLGTGGNYDAARAVGNFFFDLGNDHSPLLAEAANALPICHNLLHMIKRYAEIKRNPVLKGFCHGQRRKLATFTGNGPTFNAQYAERLDWIEGYVGGRGV